jgi:hypothetical protein
LQLYFMTHLQLFLHHVHPLLDFSLLNRPPVSLLLHLNALHLQDDLGSRQILVGRDQLGQGAGASFELGIARSDG